MPSEKSTKAALEMLDDIDRPGALHEKIADLIDAAVAEERERVGDELDLSAELRKTARRAADYGWGTCTSESYHGERLAAMDDLRRVLRKIGTAEAALMTRRTA